ncbi:recombinase family protein [Bordetella flabilis]|uniref:Resolvase/invertase-type recombinase catalytic domain-containing protein n=1 Tax=Bordetella flabilis TaxID=463014 RepID=A0A193G9Y0_9BORD|nr:recombinase family protein [Bordetella flabilis]ANN76797.1 hypothetical protein BAU07_06430 [Bordetella flabilis]
MASYGYTRVSTVDQVDNTSLDEQERRIRAVALYHDDELAEVIADAGVSGAKPLEDRPGGAKLLKRLKKGDTIIVAKLDRAFRDAADALAKSKLWKEQGIKLIVADMGTEPVTENGMAKFMFTILAAVAEMERERILERTAEGRRAKKAKGGHIGGTAPFGFRKEGAGRDAVLVPEPKEQAAIKTILTSKMEGYSLRDIAQMVRIKHDIAISHVAVQRILAQQPA